MIKVMVLS